MANETASSNTWPDLAIGLYDRLTGRGAEIEYEVHNLEVQVPSYDSPSPRFEGSPLISSGRLRAGRDLKHGDEYSSQGRPGGRTQGTVSAVVENDHFGAPSLVGSERNRAGARTVRQCARRILDSLPLRIHPAQARPNCEAALPFAEHEACAPTRPEAHLRLNCSTGNERSSKGRAVACPREDANHRDVHTSRPGGETRNLGIGGASETALRALQGYGQVNRMARGSHSYVDQKALQMIYWPGMLEAGSA